jgi:DNA-binding transcriptional regulator YiaG
MINTKQIRELLGLTQSEMARACNTSIGTVTKWDQGQRAPRGQAARLIEVLLWLKSKNMLADYLEFFNTTQR